jgi:rhamnulokinase
MPGEMLGRINRVLAAACAGPVPESPDAAPEVANLIFHSLASRYAYVLKTLTNVTGKRLKRLYVVGGGSRNDYLNALVAGRTGLEVCRGPVESSTVGNVAIQFAVLDGATEPEWGVLPDAVSAWSKKLAHAAEAQSKSAAR